MTGIANSSRNDVTSDIQMNTGIRMKVMPGARMLMIVTMKLTAPASDATPRICKPERVERHPVARQRRAQRCVAEPTAVGRAAEEEARVEEEPAEQEDPVAERVQAAGTRRRARRSSAG